MTSGRVVVVGGGVAGVATLGALRAGGYTGELALVDAAAFPYDRPPLSKDYLAGDRDLQQIALQPHEWYAAQGIDLIAGSRVTRVDPGASTIDVVLADDRRLLADWVVLATGGRAVLPAVPGLASCHADGRVHVLREAGDADGLRQVLVPGCRLLVVGGGLVGAEVASTASALGADVVVVDPLEPPLVAAVGRDLAEWLHAQHAAHDVETLATTVESMWVDPTGVGVRLRGLPQPRQFDAVLFGVGMEPVTGLALAAGLEVDDGVVVDERHVTTHPRVLAVGDCARRAGRRRAEHWDTARRDGERAAATLLGNPPPEDTASWWWSDRHGRHVEGVGEIWPAEQAASTVLRGAPGTEPFSAFAVRDGRVVGAVAVDDPSAARAARRLIDRQVRVDVGRLADRTTDLRQLLRSDRDHH